jgi:ABC-type multidrug transport system fused ATPase/permease subunit
MARDTVDSTPIEGRRALVEWFEKGIKPENAFRIGTEHEKFPFNATTLRPVSYDGARGIRALLDGMQGLLGWEPIMEGDHPIGLFDVTGGGAISLEPGGQFELSGAPVETVFPLELRDVSFHYVDGQPVLADVSAEIAQHELVGVIGPSGSGKSTLVQLLLGLRTPTEGSVLAAGVDIRSLRHADWARKVTFVPQDPVLINGSIADNLRFYRDDITEQDIERAARQAGLHDEVMAFPDRYDHQVGDRGSNLSGGQQQRVCIARALAAHPDLLILDEPTSSLDAKSETLVRDTIDALRSEMSVIVIARPLAFQTFLMAAPSVEYRKPSSVSRGDTICASSGCSISTARPGRAPSCTWSSRSCSARPASRWSRWSIAVRRR